MASILTPDSNCWRIEEASKASLIVDAADYYRHARQAMLNAQHQIILIGWDFDTRIALDGEEEADGAPNILGPFLSWLARKRPEVQIYILKWDIGALKLFGRGSTVLRLARWMAQRNITFKLDGQHPAGASHHQKILVIDDALAFCGGIDMTADRWDTRAHKDNDPGRRRPTTGRAYGPWHDATMALAGDAAKALGEHSRARWEAACGKPIAPPPPCQCPWPERLKPMFEKAQVAISRTRGATETQQPLREVERLFLDMIRSAQKFIYAENQYFASRVIGQAIADRLGQPDPPEIVLVNPDTADGWLEEAVMGPARALLYKRLRHDRFRIYTPVTKDGANIYVHAKIMIVDDQVLRVGSANMNNRSMGLDSECDVTIDARLPGNAHLGDTIEMIRLDLLGEHLGVEPSSVGQHFRQTGSLITTIEQLRGPGRSLKPLEPPEFTDAEYAIAEQQLLDPESADEPYEPAARPGLLRRMHRGRVRLTARAG